MVEIFFTHSTPRLPDSILEFYLSTLSETAKGKINKYIRWQDRQAVLFGRILLRNGLLALGYPPELSRETHVDDHGRPRFSAPLDFNISHSGDLVVCAITTAGRVGIDIEMIRRIELEDFKVALHPEEMEKISSSDDPSRTFFIHWTMKESVAKADGRGMQIPLNTVRKTGNHVRLGDTTWFVREIDIHPGYCCHLATNIKDVSFKITETSYSELS